jgi:cytochrome c
MTGSWVLVSSLLAGLVAANAWAADGPASAGDPAAGEDVFIKCSGCHQAGEGAENSIGPHLNGVIGRKAGSVPDYDYSDALKRSGLIFDEPTLRAFIHNPKAKVPGTKMNYAGLAKEKDIDDILAYFRRLGPDGKGK